MWDHFAETCFIETWLTEMDNHSNNLYLYMYNLNAMPEGFNHLNNLYLYNLNAMPEGFLKQSKAEVRYFTQ